MIQMLSIQVASLAEAMQSLQTHAMAPNPPPQVVHTPVKNPPPNVDPQARIEIERLKQTIKTLVELKNSLTVNLKAQEARFIKNRCIMCPSI